MIKRESGFTMVELLIAMVMFVLVIAASSQVFTSLLTQFKQQSKIAETNIEGIIGLELLRQDIGHAGYGLPWVIPAVYLEADNTETGASSTPQDEEWYNDSPANPPRALVSGDGDGDGIQGGTESDVLVVKAINVARNDASQKWTHLSSGNTVKEWDLLSQRLETGDRVIVLGPGDDRPLIVDVASFTTTYAENGASPDSLFDDDFAPTDPVETRRVVYGVTDDANPVTTPLRMPFNRADYYVRTPATNFPNRCAIGTGVFYKATVNQGDGVIAGGGLSELPLLDCVADMQVIYLDNGAYTADISPLTAEMIRDQVTEVRVYILVHEGQRDPNFTFTNFTCAGSCITVGEFGLGRDFDLTTITDWANYRWKVYTLVVKSNNLGG